MRRAQAAGSGRRCRAARQGCGASCCPSPRAACSCATPRASARCTLLTGCDIVDGKSARAGAARGVGVQRLGAGAPVQPQPAGADLSPRAPSPAPSRSTATTPKSEAPDIDEDRYKLVVDGLVASKQPWTLDQLYALPQETQITRLDLRRGLERHRQMDRCAAKEFLTRIGADLTAKYVHFVCAEGYSVLDRHADRPAPADADDVQVRRRDRCRRDWASPCASASPPSSASRTPSSSSASPCSTTTPAATGRIRATTGSAGFSWPRRRRRSKCPPSGGRSRSCARLPSASSVAVRRCWWWPSLTTAAPSRAGGQLGGTIELGDRATDTLRREFLEELGEPIAEPRLITVLESLYVHHGAQGHEDRVRVRDRLRRCQCLRPQRVPLPRRRCRQYRAVGRHRPLPQRTRALFPSGLIEFL